MTNVVKRICRLEDHLSPPPEPDFLRNPEKRNRIVVSRMDRKLNLETSSCTRMLSEDGVLTEVVRLDGISASFSEDELERFLARFPVQISGAVGQL
jgi:hypothetical protein